MTFFKFLASAYKVETLIGLLAFVIAAVLGYWAYISGNKLKQIPKILEKANTGDKVSLAIALTQVLPPYRIPDLTKEQGFQLAKLQLEQRAGEFNARIRLLRLGVILFFVLVVGLFVKSYIAYSNQPATTGAQSPNIKGDHATVSYTNNYGDTTKPRKDSIK